MDSYRYVKNNIGPMIDAINRGSMPAGEKPRDPAVPLSTLDKAVMQMWFEAGAPEFANQPASDVEPLELEPTWISLKENIIGPRCIQCHNSLKTRGPIDLSTSEILNEQSDYLFDDMNPFNSRFVGAIIAREEQDYFDPMPPPWSRINLPEVTGEELEVIQEWIRLGRPSGLPSPQIVE